MDDCHVLVLVVVVREFLAQLNYKAAVDFFNNLIYTREEPLEDFDWPLLKSLSKNCMICISKSMSYYIPCFIPAYIVFINQNTHKFRNCNYRVSIVELNYVELCKLREICSVVTNIVANKILQRSRREEVLLFKAESLSARAVIVRVQNAADIFCAVLALYGTVVIHAVEELKVKAVWT